MQQSHAAIKCATEMAHSHNVLLRGLNSIYQQAPHVHQQEDARDLLFYCRAWATMVEHHHDTEESHLFPDLDALTGTPALTATNREQHRELHAGLHSLTTYAESTAPEDYVWESGLRPVLDSFTPSFVQHLRDEIQTLLDLRTFDNDKLAQIWNKTEEAAKGAKHPHLFVSC